VWTTNATTQEDGLICTEDAPPFSGSVGVAPFERLDAARTPSAAGEAPRSVGLGG